MMGSITCLSKLSRLSLLSLLASTLPLSQALEIISRRATTCGGNTGLFQCGTGFPSEFCCPQGSTCTPINGTASVATICCPSGSNCDFVQPIVCDVTQLNATAHPDNQIHISDTNGVQLPKCGSGCCPPGYSCNGGVCSANETSATPSGTPSTTTLSPSGNPTLAATEPASASQTTNPAPAPIVKQEQGFDGKSFAAGFFPGIVLGGLAIVGLIWAVKKRREQQDRERYSGDFGHVSRQISDPIYDPAQAARVDFIRRGSQSAQASPSTIEMVKPMNQPTGGMTPRIKSLWARSPKLGFGNFSVNSTPKNIARPAPAVRAGNGDPYRTPDRTPNRKSSSRRQQRPLTGRTNSSETIDVLMPAPNFLEPPKAPGMREHRMTQDSGQTTFTKLMERAGYEEDSREEVRGWKGSPSRAR